MYGLCISYAVMAHHHNIQAMLSYHMLIGKQSFVIAHIFLSISILNILIVFLFCSYIKLLSFLRLII